MNYKCDTTEPQMDARGRVMASPGRCRRKTAPREDTLAYACRIPLHCFRRSSVYAPTKLLPLFPRPSFLVVMFALLATVLQAQTPVPPNPVVGSSNPVTAEPSVLRPSTTPCIVPLFTGQQFIDYTDKNFTYSPPAGCPGPWSKVVFTADFNVSAGRQFDRTAKFFIGGANFYFGTTAEPRSALSPSWHVERDISELSPLLGATQPVVASLGNFYGVSGGVDYNGIITGTAQLEFYPVGPKDGPATVPDAVLPLDPAGETTALQTTADRLTGTFNSLPRNIEGAYLELFSQSQANDEFWYTCSPNSVAAQLDGNCGNTGFRETEVYVDGAPAGIAPVLPWIYTGGIDPALWEPITGVQTLNFKPYLVDLTPFAGLLSDGSKHTVSMGVFNADSEFDVTGTLLLYLDHGSTQVTGAVTENTLGAAPTPNIQAEAPVDATGTTHGKTFVTSQRSFLLSGYVKTSQGIVTTTINEQVNFANYQLITFNNAVYSQDLAQVASATSDTRKQTGLLVEETQKTTVYPLTFNYNSVSNPDDSGSLYVHVYQQDFEYTEKLLNGLSLYSSGSQEVVGSTDQYAVNTSGAVENESTTSNAEYQATDTQGYCYSRALTATGLALATVTDGASCGGVNKP